MKDTKKLYLVWTPCGTECVGFTDENDATYASTGKRAPSKLISNIADNFRDVYYETDLFTVTEANINGLNVVTEQPSLRDQFAMASLTGILSSLYDCTVIAEQAYKMADAMLAERAKRANNE